MIRHISGGLSMLKFRNYMQSPQAWQGPPVDLVWWDEEPPQSLYDEGLARTIAVKGITMMTFTPLLGYTPVVNLYLKDADPGFSDRHSTHMTLHDAEHMTKEERDAEIRRWPKHKRRARIEGLPAMGVGQIYPYEDDELFVRPFAIPEHWPVLGAIDLAGSSDNPSSHPTAAVKLAWDRDHDCIYVVKEYRKKGLKPSEHWLTLRFWGNRMKWAWPKDGMAEEKGSGDQLIAMYRSEGMRAMSIHAQFPKENRKTRGGSSSSSNLSVVSVERGILDIQTRIDEARFKIFDTCPLIMEELRQYHRDEENKIVKVMDDLLDAARYGVMMKRFAETLNQRREWVREEIDPVAGM